MGRAPGIVQINQYAQRTSAKGRAMPRAPLIEQPVGDLQNFMGDAAAGVGALANMAERKEQVDIAVERIAQARDEDDARAYSAAALADATARYAARAREVESAAPDGWRGLTESSNTAFQEIDAQIIGAAPTETAQRYVAQHLGILRSEALMRTATRETELRRGWRTDTLEASASQWERTLAVDPSQWARAHATMSQTIGSMTDITADDRRDLSARTSERLAYFAVAGMVEADPAAALALLRGGQGASAEIMGPQLSALFGGAQVTSGRRTPERNAAVGGAENSNHLLGQAVDLAPPAQYQGMGRAEIEADARQRLAQQFPGVTFSEVIWEGDHLHVAWEGGAEAEAQQGPIANLSAEHRLQLLNRAQAGQTQIAASLRDTLNAQEQLLRRGIVPSNPLSVEAVSANLGTDVAQNYAALYEQANAQQLMRTMPSATVAQVATGAPVPGEMLLRGATLDQQRLIADAQREAARAVLTQREQDPGEYLLRAGVMRNPNLFQAMEQAGQSGDWSGFQQVLRNRGADAVEARNRGLAPRVAPLTVAEAGALRDRLGRASAQDRLGFFSQAASAMNPEAYRAMMVQIAPDGGEVMAFAGFAYGSRGRFDGPTVAQRLLRGADILQGRESGEDRQRRPPVAMPTDAQLRLHWENIVRPGDTYAGMRDSAEPAYAAFRAYYAALSEEEGGSTTLNDQRARAAIDVATGGAANWSGRPTLLPWGMERREFESAIRRGFEQTPALRGRNPRDYDLVAVGGGLYLVEGETHPQTGLPIYVQAVPGARR